MGKQLNVFPLIADDEPVISSPRMMGLYGNEDLIINIRGDYQEKFFENEDEQPGLSGQPYPAPVTSDRSEVDRLKQAARADLKKKRQALVVNEKRLTPKPVAVSSAMVQKPTAPLVEREEKGWGDYAKALEQTDYILVELPRSYEQPKNPSTRGQHKQNFDFLKQSQVYNYDDNQRQRERKIAQELNLSAFDERQ